MTLTGKQAWTLVAAAVWTFYVWITRIANILRTHHTTAFVVVHVGLAVVSIAFAVAILRIGIAARRRNDAAPPPTEPAATPTSARR